MCAQRWSLLGISAEVDLGGKSSWWRRARGWRGGRVTWWPGIEEWVSPWQCELEILTSSTVFFLQLKAGQTKKDKTRTTTTTTKN